MNDSAFLGRLPIFDHAHRTVAHELFVRDGVSDTNSFGDPERASRRLLVATGAHAGFDEFIGNADVWTPVSAGSLQGGQYRSLPAKRSVLEVTPATLATPEISVELEGAKAEGYRFALDLVGSPLSGDPIGAADANAMLRYIDAVKVSVAGGVNDVHRRLCGEAAKRSLIRLACGVDTLALADASFGEFSLLQGRFVLQPAPGGQGARIDRLAALQLVAELERPDVTFDDLEKIIARDASLTLRVLTLANSGLFTVSKRIDTARAALVMLGLRNVRYMALMVTLGAISDVPSELTLTALIRARHCEVLANQAGLRSEAAFTSGLLSLVGVFAGLPTHEALTKLPITDEVRDAIADHAGPLGTLLTIVEECETGTVHEALSAPWPGTKALDLDLLATTYAESTIWAERLRNSAVSSPATASV